MKFIPIIIGNSEPGRCLPATGGAAEPVPIFFFGIDPLADKYPGWSPYNYTLNIPLRFIDPDGKRVIERDKNGKVIFTPTRNVNMKHDGDKKNPNGVSVQEGYLKADDGRKIVAYKNLSGDSRYDTDCHGVTFADGEYWINNDQVNDIIEGDNYQSTTNPSQGSVAVFSSSNVGVVHSVTVVSAKNTANSTVTNDIVVQGLGVLKHRYIKIKLKMLGLIRMLQLITTVKKQKLQNN